MIHDVDASDHLTRPDGRRPSRRRFPLSIRDAAIRGALIVLMGAAIPSSGEEPRREKTSPGFVLVELFTSEGCSSCPPADQVLAEIDAEAGKTGQSVYVLSYHVDYWNNLGWKDPFSRKQATDRQHAYARIFGADRVYTPQMIINGAVEFVGSNRRRATFEVAGALAKKSSAQLTIQSRADGRRITVDYKTVEPPDESSVIIALARKFGQSSVTAGENESRKLRHVNIVHDLHAAPVQPTGSSAKFELPANSRPADFRIVAFIQSPDGRVAAANGSELQKSEDQP